MNIFNSIIIWASGARPKLLDKASEIEKRKFQLIGASLLISSLLSTISAFYAILLISNNLISSFLIGLMWGVMITNLNRLFIASIIDNHRKPQRKLLWFIISFNVSCVIAYTIAFPLQLKIFEKEINANIIHKRSLIIEKNARDYDKKIDYAYATLNDYENLFYKELSGVKNGITSGTMGYGNRAIFIKEKIEDQKRLIDTLRFEKGKLRLNIFSSQSNFIEKVNSLNELIKQHSFFRYTYLLILLILIFVESTPFLIALISKRGLYEELVLRVDSTHFTFEENRINNNNINSQPIAKSKSFENYCINSITDINHHIDNLKLKAQEQLRTGLLISLLGILAYLGYGTFLFIVYFENHQFHNHHIFLFSSLSVIFFFMQFLAGWYLKQYRTTIDYANTLNVDKEKYNKYILAKLTTSELQTNDANKLLETKLLIDLINGSNLTNSNPINNSDNSSNGNFAKDVFDSINNIKDLINNLGKK